MRYGAKRHRACALAVIALCVAIAGCSGGDSPSASKPVAPQASPPAGASEAKLLTEGEALFNEMCKSCHGRRGSGDGTYSGPSLQRAQFSFGRTPEEVSQSIRGGRPGGMPSFGHVFTTAQLQAVVAYVLSLKK